jgi:hypothetical protein
VGDVLVFDRTDGSTTRVSVGPDDAQADGMSADPSISPDGRYVAFWSAAANLVPDDTNGKRDIFLHDREAGSLTRVSVADDGTQGDGDSFSPNIGAGGALVAFDSAAKTLVPDDRKTRGSDIFLYWEDMPPTAGRPAAQPASAENGDSGPPANPAPPDNAPTDESTPPDNAPTDESTPPDNAGSKPDNARANRGRR